MQTYLEKEESMHLKNLTDYLMDIAENDIEPISPLELKLKNSSNTQIELDDELQIVWPERLGERIPDLMLPNTRIIAADSFSEAATSDGFEIKVNYSEFTTSPETFFANFAHEVGHTLADTSLDLPSASLYNMRGIENICNSAALELSDSFLPRPTAGMNTIVRMYNSTMLNEAAANNYGLLVADVLGVHEVFENVVDDSNHLYEIAILGGFVGSLIRENAFQEQSSLNPTKIRLRPNIEKALEGQKFELFSYKSQSFHVVDVDEFLEICNKAYIAKLALK